MRTSDFSLNRVFRCIKTASLFLFAAIIFLFAAIETLANETVPYRAAFTGKVIQVTLNADGTRDHVEFNIGHGTHIGNATQLATYRVELPVYDVVSNSLLIHLHGAFMITAANGDTLEGSFDAVETVPLDEQFQPLPPPYAFHVAWDVDIGAGRFVGVTGNGSSSGLDNGDGTISRTDAGTLTSVGSSRH